ncbi:hypothetical protein llap_12545 [Limosa lapponica baueri]|uniref:Uncharacterized protein n=1 Tax=Limosa lapponica baueri TaxID=1758121 RepID=A0A2I0TTM6_LIMLA|nr:hypothetical protein llap_12545 [Limosa lapponica baueri]
MNFCKLCPPAVEEISPLSSFAQTLSQVITAGLSPFFFVMTANVLTISCLVISGVGEALLVYTERTGT